MKAISYLIGAGGLALAASQANATITVTLTEGSTTQTYNFANGGSQGALPVTVGDFTVYFTAAGSGSPSSPNLFTNTLDITSAASNATLTVDVLQQGLVGVSGILLSSFTANGIGIAQVVESTLLNGNPLASQTFGSNNLGATVTQSNPVSLSGSYTDETKFVVTTAAGGGTANSTINLTSAVPESASWAMMLVGFGLIGATLRQRRPAEVTFG